MLQDELEMHGGCIGCAVNVLRMCCQMGWKYMWDVLLAMDIQYSITHVLCDGFEMHVGWIVHTVYMQCIMHV